MSTLSNREWIENIVVTRRQMADGSTIYFPRNQRTLQKLYKIDSVLCGWKDRKHLPRKTIIVDTEDNIL